MLAKRLAFFGDASYSIYLSHTFVVPAAVMLLRKLGAVGFLPIVVTVGLAALIGGSMAYVWIERPMTNLLKRAFLTRLKPTYSNIN
jgi:peptidoglycan/LPS O-acetylase OafA/YrhL